MARYWLYLYLPHICYSSKILLLPFGDKVNSHMMKMIQAGNILHDDGHHVSMVLPSTASHLLKGNSKINPFILELPYDYKISNRTGLSVEENLSVFNLNWILSKLIEKSKRICTLLFGSDLPNNLKAENFDLVIVDVIDFCKKLLADYLNTTIVQYSTWGIFMDHHLFYPSIPSITCSPELQKQCLDAGIPSFLTRLEQAVFNALIYFTQPYIDKEYEEIR